MHKRLPGFKFLFGYKKLNVLLFISLLVRLGIFWASKSWQQEILNHVVLQADAVGYHLLALKILNEFSFGGDSFRTPGYPFFIAVVYFFFGVKPYAVLVVQIFVNLFSIVLVYHTARRMFSKAAGMVAAVLFAFEPHNLMYIFSLWSETLFVGFTCLTVFLIVRAVQDRSSRQLILAGMVLALTILIRPVLEFYPLAIIGFLICYFWKSPRHLFTGIAAFLIGVIMLLTPWLLRNYREFNRLQLSSMTGYNLLVYNASYFEATQSNMRYEEAVGMYNQELWKQGYKDTLNPDNLPVLPADTSNPFMKSDRYQELAFSKLRPRFKTYLAEHLKGMVMIHISPGTKIITKTLNLPTAKLAQNDRLHSGIAFYLDYFFTKMYWYESLATIYMVVFLCFIYLFSLLTLVKQWKNRNNRLLVLLLLGTAVYFTLISGILAHTRYRVPSMPFLIIAAGFAGSSFLTKVHRRFFRRPKKVFGEPDYNKPSL
ncbi:MAG: glycosyltransferase family 39 protein [Chitinophagaceae bacterium]